MNERCEICHKRRYVLPYVKVVIVDDGILVLRMYSSDHTEEVCFGHETRTPVPQVFYDAFSE